ncbi:lipoate--protein ligase family protein [Paenibacillus typhae]|uniref:Octanoyl-[GcvH]:protein N-octanoyltransferase n=1 Tax=Paenibacillus typhae TaxID=1174501 RepID=A0A1G8SQX1_9BACL|nr:octanoyl-[GcvH]:protein N-octanoyltransferase [Paenibacillus typhae]
MQRAKSHYKQEKGKSSVGSYEEAGEIGKLFEGQKQSSASELPSRLVLFEHPAEELTAEEAGDMLIPFAFEEALCRDVGAGLVPPCLHIWSHPGGVVLGLRDSKLPHAAAAMAGLEQAGYRTAVRHSGGAAVPLDTGIVNVSLVLPKAPGKLDFHDDFRLLASLIAEAAAASNPQAAAQIRAGEIAGSYCPGDFDLAIGGRKFCGIAQRRQSGAYFVHAFVVVSGSGRKRGELIRGFYETASGGDESLDYPRVRPETIAALGELGGPDAAAVYAAGIRQAAERRGVQLTPAGRLRQETGYDLQYSDPRVLETAATLRQRYAR